MLFHYITLVYVCACVFVYVCPYVCVHACVRMCVFHLLVWIRVVVESYSTVICDFRQILIIKLLKTNVMGRPGRKGGRTLKVHTDSRHTTPTIINWLKLIIRSRDSRDTHTFVTHTHQFVISPPVLMYLTPPPFKGEHLSDSCPHRLLRPWGSLLWDMACHCLSVTVCLGLCLIHQTHKTQELTQEPLCSLNRQRSSALFSIFSGPQFTDITVLKWLHHPVFLVSIKHLYICGPLVPTEAQLSTQPSTPLVRDCVRLRGKCCIAGFLVRTGQSRQGLVQMYTEPLWSRVGQKIHRG